MRAREVGRGPLRQGPGEGGVDQPTGMRAPRRLALPQRGGTPGPQPARFGPSLSSRGAGRTPRGLSIQEEQGASGRAGINCNSQESLLPADQ